MYEKKMKIKNIYTNLSVKQYEECASSKIQLHFFFCSVTERASKSLWHRVILQPPPLHTNMKIYCIYILRASKTRYIQYTSSVRKKAQELSIKKPSRHYFDRHSNIFFLFCQHPSTLLFLVKGLSLALPPTNYSVDQRIHRRADIACECVRKKDKKVMIKVNGCQGDEIDG